MVSPGLPSLVYKRDGRLVPFEADNISQSLYAATEDLGQPNAFLARELTDGVLHFLGEEVGADQPTTAQIAELVAKVVRELGQPALAHVYAEGQRRRHQATPTAQAREKSARFEGIVHFSNKDAPDAVVGQCLRSFSLQAVFARDLAAAHEEKLLALGGLDHPDELARLVLDPEDGADGWLALLNTPARTIVFDGPEYALTEDRARPWLQQLAQFCAATKRNALLNLHVSPPPAWAPAAAGGPLFKPITASSVDLSRVSLILLEESLGKPYLNASWHLSDVDFGPGNGHTFDTVIQKARAGSGLGFTLDRPKRRVILAPGVDRGNPAALLDVTLDLPRFLRMPKVDNDARLFLEKLPSLARMAVRAAVQKRKYLRSRCAERPALARGFLLERARLVVVPRGLDEVVASLLGQGMAGSKLSLDLARQTVDVLKQTFETESQATNLEMALDGPDGAFPGPLGPCDAKLLHAAGVLQGVAGFGSVRAAGVGSEELIVLLAYALKKTDVVRLVV